MTFRRYVVLTNMGTIYNRYWTRKGARSIAARMAAHGSTYSVARAPGKPGERGPTGTTYTDVFMGNLAVDEPRRASEAELGLMSAFTFAQAHEEELRAKLQEVLMLLITCAEVHLKNLRMDTEVDEKVKNDLLAIFTDARVFLNPDPEQWGFTSEAIEAGTRIVLGPDPEFEKVKRERDALAVQLANEWTWPLEPSSVLTRLRGDRTSALLTFCDDAYKTYLGVSDA